MNPLIQSFIQNEISSLMSNLNSMFPNDELAYYSLQGKNELQIRDKVAWELQQRIDNKFGQNKFIVRREWSMKGRSKFDMAVLEVDPNNTDKSEPVALLEFKAQSFVNKEDWFYGSFYLDVKNMWGFCSKRKDVDMYFIFLHSTQSQNHTAGGYGDAVTYKEILDHKNTLLSMSPSLISKVSSVWNGFYNNGVIQSSMFSKNGNLKKHFNIKGTGVGNPPLINYNVKYTAPTPKFLSFGKSFGYEWLVAPMIWGPFKYGDINIK